MLQQQLAELRNLEDITIALTLDAEDEASAEAAQKLQEQERLHAEIARHDAAFALKLAMVDDETWEEVGDNMEDPCELELARGELPIRPSRQGGPAAVLPAHTAGRTLATPRDPCSSSRNSCSSKGAASASGPSKAGVAAPSMATAGPSTSTQPLAKDTTACLSCLDTFATTALTCAGADAPGTSSAPAGCGHLFCEGCMRDYVRGAVRARTYPLPCPMAGSGCTVALSHDAAAELLARDAEDVKALGLLAAESAIPPDQRVYCPHKDCSTLLSRSDEDHAPDEPITCPACSRVFCLHCRIPGWHKGFTCAQFQALPPDQRSAEDAAVLHLSQQQGWKRCPNATCRLLVERVDGCNHMKCRCGSDFCYACGSVYKDTRPTAGNEHGTPGCQCPLFDVPAEGQQHGGGGPGGGGGNGGGGNGNGGGGNGARPPMRNGRKVSRTACRHAHSIHDCPKGDSCWFWHEEDGRWW